MKLTRLPAFATVFLLSSGSGGPSAYCLTDQCTGRDQHRPGFGAERLRCAARASRGIRR